MPRSANLSVLDTPASHRPVRALRNWSSCKELPLFAQGLLQLENLFVHPKSVELEECRHFEMVEIDRFLLQHDVLEKFFFGGGGRRGSIASLSAFTPGYVQLSLVFKSDLFLGESLDGYETPKTFVWRTSGARELVRKLLITLTSRGSKLSLRDLVLGFFKLPLMQSLL